MGAQLSQIIPPTATLTEANLPSQKGKTFVVTGGYGGVGLELSRILYNAGGHVIIAGRNQTSADRAIQDISSSSSAAASARGTLEFLYLDLGDLSKIKASAEQLTKNNVAIDVLFNNAARGTVAPNSFSAQGLEVTVATNVLGAFLFTKLLEPCLTTNCASNVPPARVVWAASQVIDLLVPKNGLLSEYVKKPVEEQMRDLPMCYTWSKMGNWYLASEYGRRNPKVFSVAQNPGALRTGILREQPWYLAAFLYPILYPAKQGAYTELWCGLSEEINIEQHQGAYVLPWGRLHTAPRGDLLVSMKGEDEGGTGEAAKVWEWCEEMTREYQ